MPKSEYTADIAQFLSDVDAFLSDVDLMLDKVRALMNREFGITGLPVPSGGLERGTSEELRFAKAYYVSRRMRDSILPTELLGEPGYDILLFAFIAYEEGAEIVISDVCAASGAPNTTALRWIEKMEGLGLLVKESPQIKTRRIPITISAKGRSIIMQHINKTISYLYNVESKSV